MVRVIVILVLLALAGWFLSFGYGGHTEWRTLRVLPIGDRAQLWLEPTWRLQLAWAPFADHLTGYPHIIVPSWLPAAVFAFYPVSFAVSRLPACRLLRLRRGDAAAPASQGHVRKKVLDRLGRCMVVLLSCLWLGIGTAWIASYVMDWRGANFHRHRSHVSAYANRGLASLEIVFTLPFANSCEPFAVHGEWRSWSAGAQCLHCRMVYPVDYYINPMAKAHRVCDLVFAAVFFPLWSAFLICGTYPAIVAIRGPVRRYRRRKRGLCIQCAYDLTGNESGRCPECGRRIEC